MDYLDTFAPVAKLNTVRFILSIVVMKNWPLKQLDVNNAFLHGDLNEVIYMQLPLGMKVKGENQVCLLNKSLYGLKNASRQWYAKLCSFLLMHDFKQTSVDHSLFVKHVHNKITILPVYVDDIILTGNDIDVIHDTTTMLDNAFKIKNLGDLTYFLGFEVARNSKGIHLSQRKYTLDMLDETGMLESSPVSTPMNFSTN